MVFRFIFFFLLTERSLNGSLKSHAVFCYCMAFCIGVFILEVSVAIVRTDSLTLFHILIDFVHWLLVLHIVFQNCRPK